MFNVILNYGTGRRVTTESKVSHDNPGIILGAIPSTQEVKTPVLIGCRKDINWYRMPAKITAQHNQMLFLHE